MLNLGNPQAFPMNPITFNREVIACLLTHNPEKNASFSPDAVKRARKYLDTITSMGAYSDALGSAVFRKSVAKYISRAD